MGSTEPLIGRLGWIALKAGVLDLVQLKECLHAQSAGTRVGEIMRTRGLVDEAGLLELLSLQDAWLQLDRRLSASETEALVTSLVQTRQFTAEGVRRLRGRPRSTRRMGLGPTTGRLGWVAVHAGRLQALELAEVLARQHRLTDPRPLGALLVEQGLVTLDELERMLELQRAWNVLRDRHELSPADEEKLARALTTASRYDLSALLEPDARVREIFAEVGIAYAFGPSPSVQALDRLLFGTALEDVVVASLDDSDEYPAVAPLAESHAPEIAPAVLHFRSNAPAPPAPAGRRRSTTTLHVTGRPDPAARLGELAVHAGLIRADELTACRALAREEDVLLGHVLLEEGLIDADELDALLVLQEAWREVCATHELGHTEAEALIARLAERDLLGPEALAACIAWQGSTTEPGGRVTQLVNVAARRRSPAPRPPGGFQPVRGRLGWVAVQSGMVTETELDACLKTQCLRTNLQLGEILIERQLVAGVALPSLLETQRAWAELERELQLDPNTADALARLLVSRQRFDTATLQRCLRPEQRDSSLRLMLELAGLDLDAGSADDSDVGSVGQVGWLAVTLCEISESTIERALALTRARAVKGDRVPLGQQLVTMGELDDAQLQQLLDIQQRIWLLLDRGVDERSARSLIRALRHVGQLDSEALDRAVEHAPLPCNELIRAALGELEAEQAIDEMDTVEVPAVSLAPSTHEERRVALQAQPVLGPTSLHPGKLGWIAYRSGYVTEVDVEGCLMLQQAMLDMQMEDAHPRLGDLMLEQGLLGEDQLYRALILQRAWRHVVRTFGIEPLIVEDFARRLQRHDRFDLRTLDRCVAARPEMLPASQRARHKMLLEAAGLHGEAALIAAADSIVGETREMLELADVLDAEERHRARVLHEALVAEGLECTYRYVVAQLFPGVVSHQELGTQVYIDLDPERAQRLLEEIERRELIEIADLRRAARLAAIYRQHGCRRSVAGVLGELGLLAREQIDVLLGLGESGDASAPSKLVTGWAGCFGLIVRDADDRSLLNRIYRFYDGDHEIGRAPRSGFTIADPSIAEVHALLHVDGEQVVLEPIGVVELEVDDTYEVVSEPTPLDAGERFRLGRRLTIQFLDADGIAEDSQFYTLTVQEIFGELSIVAQPKRTKRGTRKISNLSIDEIAPEVQDVETTRAAFERFHDESGDRLLAIQTERAERAEALAARRLAAPARRRRLRMTTLLATGAVLVALAASALYLTRERPQKPGDAPQVAVVRVPAGPAPVPGERVELRGVVLNVTHHQAAAADGASGFYAEIGGDRPAFVQGTSELWPQLDPTKEHQVVAHGVWKTVIGRPLRLSGGQQARHYIQLTSMRVTR